MTSRSFMNFNANGNIIQEPPSNDGGDSLNRDGQFWTLAWVWSYVLKMDPFQVVPHPKGPTSVMLSHVTRDGHMMRNASQEPDNNWRNCTRDQQDAAMIACGLYNLEWIPRMQIVEMIKRFGFYQNTERDYAGTKKSLFPRYVKAGTRLEDRRWAEKDGWIWEPNYADISLPNNWSLHLRAADLWYLHPLVLLGDVFLLISVHVHCRIYSRDPYNVDDMQLLLALVQTKLKWPTWISRKAIKTYFALRPTNVGNISHVDIHGANNCYLVNEDEREDGVIGAIAYYFRGPRFGAYDSPQFLELWRPVIKWLKE